MARANTGHWEVLAEIEFEKIWEDRVETIKREITWNEPAGRIPTRDQLAVKALSVGEAELQVIETTMDARPYEYGRITSIRIVSVTRIPA